ncbi:hypothetical protein IMG5_128580 [Ichthyophthirius multifiliis]|uniref:MSP domain-containing protein n=1 Tax=Ichthyophthirius multifiliis TaxID=5932 RepID=G0QW15_ICHMU|nr:hypothetical protein IMG5_128580 [Ichthyophthirius multifiliis]EGR30591.1 hypothetical protein IMG5_128580 [Ichthyophthirius multifiliis]|eukprot:XP_004032178.1 hypothetical protein IMG5_128580 [Ichthyophthirius multifiliis]
MSIIFEIQFQSTCFKECIDKLVILTELNVFEIPLIARRAPPLLNLPPVLEVKSCWVGEISQQNYKITNKGGDAGFRFFSEDEKDEEEEDLKLKIGNFQIYPCEFYLQKGESIDINIYFKPQKEGLEEKNIILVCDSDIQAKYKLIGNGNMCFLKVLAIDDNKILENQESLQKIFFEKADCNIKIQRKIQIQNQSDVFVNFHWNIFPQKQEKNVKNLQSAFNIKKNNKNSIQNERIIENNSIQIQNSKKNSFFQQNDDFLEGKNSCFEIFPQKGFFSPMEIKEFSFEFLSKNPYPVFENTVFFIDEVPFESIKGIKQNLLGFLRKKSDFNPPFLGSNSNIPSIPFIDLEVVGICGFSEIFLDKPFHVFGEELEINKKYEVKVKIRKNSKAPIQLKIEEEFKTEGMFWETNQIFLKIYEKNEEEISIFFGSKKEGKNKKIIFKISSENTFLQTFEILSDFQRNSVSVKNSLLDFGLMNIWEKKQKQLEIYNDSQDYQEVLIKNTNEKVIQNTTFYPSLDKLRKFKDFFIQEEIQEDISSQKNTAILRISQPQIKIPPKSSFFVQIELEAGKSESFSSCLEVISEKKDSIYVNVEAEIQDIQIALNNLDINLPCLYANKKIEIDKEIYLENQGNIDAFFTWENIQTELLEVICEPKQGEIKAKEKIKMKIIVLGKKGGVFEELLLCKIKEKKEFLGIFFKGEVFGLNVELKKIISDEKLGENEQKKNYLDNNENLFNSLVMKSNVKNSFLCNSMRTSDIFKAQDSKGTQNKQFNIHLQKKISCEKIDFFNCIINQPKHIFIVLENKSGISTSFELSIEKFQPFQKKNLETEQSQTNTKTNLLTDEIEKTQNFNSKQGQELNTQKTLEKKQQIYLQNNKGFAILCEPSKAKLSSYDTSLIKVTLFNDISGIQQDTLNINIQGLPLMKVPINIQVIGSPIIISPYQLGIDYEQQIPFFFLGHFSQNSPKITRFFKVLNTGPKPIKIKWQIYNLDNNCSEKFFNISFQNPPQGFPFISKLHFQSIPPPTVENGPFEIFPKEQTINGREEKKFSVSFFASNSSTFNSVLIGKPELNIQAEDIEDLTLYISATTAQSYLKIDKIPEGKPLKFQKNNNSIENKNEKKTLTLINENFENLKFEVQTEGPFLIEKIESNSQKNFLFQNSLLKTSKKELPLESLKTAFWLEKNSHFSLLIKFSPSNQIYFQEGKLIILFENGDTQEIRLQGKILKPQIEVNFAEFENVQADNLQDFGITHIKDTKKLRFFIANQSKVPASWKICHVKNPFRKYKQILDTMTQEDYENNNTIDDLEVFSFSKNEGFLNGPSVPIKKWPNCLALPSENTQKRNIQEGISPQDVFVCFQPKKNVIYKSKFKICIENGDDVYFILKGVSQQKFSYCFIISSQFQ